VTCWEADYGGTSQGTGWEVIDWIPIGCPWDNTGGGQNNGGNSTYDPFGNPDPGTNGGYVYTSDAGFNSGGTSGYSQGYTGPATSPFVMTWEQRLLLDFKGTLNSAQRSFMSSHPAIKLDIHLFLLNNTSPFIDLGSSTNMQTIAAELINILIANPNMDFKDALENYYDDNPEDFMANFEYDQNSDDQIIPNMEDYLDCFNDGKDAINYEFVIYVDQPERGEDTVVTADPATVGHAFFSLVKNNTDGSNVTKTLGFYPEDDSYLLDLTDLEGPGVFQENGNLNQEHDFDVSISFTDLNVGQFSGIILDLIAYENADYDLNDFNCTSMGHLLAVNNLGFTMSPNTSMYRWFAVGASLVWGVSPGQYGVDLMEEEYTADVPYLTSMNFSEAKPKTSTSNCN